jgi:hypothetical protein
MRGTGFGSNPAFRLLAHGGTLHPRAVRKHTHRQPAVPQIGDLGLLSGLSVACQLVPLKRNIAALQKVAQCVGL